MSMPFYVSPEQVMADKAEFARKGVARGKPSIVIDQKGHILGVANGHEDRGRGDDVIIRHIFHTQLKTRYIATFKGFAQLTLEAVKIKGFGADQIQSAIAHSLSIT